MLCPDCSTPLKPLFTGFFCPNDCDRPKSPTPAKRIDFATIKKDSSWASAGANVFPWVGGWFGNLAPAPSSYTPATGQCRKPVCRGQGKHLYSSWVTDVTGKVSGYDKYECTICNAQHDEVNNSGTPPTLGSTIP